MSNIIDSPRLNDATPATTKVMTTTPKEKAAERAALRAAEVKKIQDGRVQAQEMKQAAVAEKKAATAAARGVARASSEPLYKALRKSSAPISDSSYDGIMSKMDISAAKEATVPTKAKRNTKANAKQAEASAEAEAKAAAEAKAKNEAEAQAAAEAKAKAESEAKAAAEAKAKAESEAKAAAEE